MPGPNLSPARGCLDYTRRMELDFIHGSDGSRLRVAHAGSGPTVVLAHGYLLDHSLYAPLIPLLLDKGYRVIAFDQRGHGASRPGSEGMRSSAMAADYLSVLEHFAVEGAQLVAHSMGTFLSIIACLQHPERMRRHIRSIVWLGPTAGKTAEKSLQNRLQVPLLKSGLMSFLWRQPALGAALVRQLFGPHAKPEWIESTRRLLLEQDVRQSLPILQALLYEDYYPRVPEISLPVKILCGSHDRTCPRWHAETLARDIPGASLRILPDIGHMIPFEAPAEILAALD
jgi:non-heme chloroperoxidase